MERWDSKGWESTGKEKARREIKMESAFRSNRTGTYWTVTLWRVLPVPSSTLSPRSLQIHPDTLLLYKMSAEKFRQLVPCTGGCHAQQPLCQPWGTSKSRSSLPECCWLLQAFPGLLLGNNHTWAWRQAEHLSRVRSAGPELQPITPHCLKAVADHSQ